MLSKTASFMYKNTWLITVGFTALVTASCMRSSESMEKIPDQYAQGQLQAAKNASIHLINEKNIQADFRRNPSSVWYLLFGALSSHASADFEQAIPFYDKSLQAIDFYSQDSTIENIQTLLLDDRHSAYSGDIFEQLLARLYFSMALEHSGRHDDSAALLRQHENTLDVKREHFKKIPFLSHLQVQSDAVAKYLLACHLEHQGDSSNAKILFSQVEQLTKASFITNDLEKVGNRGEQAWLVVVVHRGRLAPKINTYSVGAIASMSALEKFMQNRRIDPAWSTLTGLAIPGYKIRVHDEGPSIQIEIDKMDYYPSPFFNITETACSELNQRLPVIAARALARQIIRQGVARKYLSKDESATGVSSDFFLLLANINTRADVRSWAILPSSLECFRIDLEPGFHHMHITPRELGVDSSKPASLDYDLKLHPGLNLIEIYAPQACWAVMDSQLQIPNIELNSSKEAV